MGTATILESLSNLAHDTIKPNNKITSNESSYSNVVSKNNSICYEYWVTTIQQVID